MARRGSDDPFRAIWDHGRKPKGSYRRHHAFFDDLPGMYDETLPDQVEYWQSYVRYMVKSGSEYPRNDPRNPWWGIIGMNPGDFDWDGWRQAMGYKARKR